MSSRTLDQGQIVYAQVLGGRYVLNEVIGSGATATIWRAWDRRLDRAVAVKVLDGAALHDRDDKHARFRDEARTLARLSHQNIVSVFDSGADNGLAYVVMELVDGPNAVSRLNGGVMSVAEAASVMAQVCDALTAAHAAGVVHRDIKPGNILIGPGQTVKVCDFGIARLLDATVITSPDIALGTSSYISPEQVAGYPVDGRADLYAVGCVLFRMLTGTAPFVGDSPFNVAYQQLHSQPPTVQGRRPDVPDELNRLISRLLEKDPALRPQTADQVRAELLRWTRPTAAVVATSTRRRRPFAAVIVIAVATLAVPAVLLLTQDDTQRSGQPASPVAPAASATAPSSPAPSLSPAAVATATAAARVAAVQSQQSLPSPLPVPGSPLDQIMDLKGLVRDMESGGQLPSKNADDLDHMLNDLSHLIVEGKNPEAQAKLTAIQKKIDDLLLTGKLSVVDHTMLEGGLAQLALAIPDPVA